jgi:hypothetical protein
MQLLLMNNLPPKNMDLHKMASVELKQLMVSQVSQNIKFKNCW